MKFKLFLFSLIIISSSVFGQNVKITGEVLNSNYSKINLLNAYSNDVIATSDITDGKFNFVVDITNEDLYVLELDKENSRVLDIKPKEKITVTYDLTGDFTVEGSEGTTIFNESLDGYKLLTTEKEAETYILNLMKENPGSLAVVLFAMAIETGKNIDAHNTFLKSLDPIKENTFVMEYNKMISSELKTAVGSIAPEIELENPDGEMVKLSSLRGQYVLIDFWAAWCRPCRGENPNVVDAFNKYHDKGFTVYGVSLDNKKADWVAAIEKDGLTWTQVSDLQGWNSSAGREYGISSIPANFLIDPEGKIIAKNLRGSALHEKLSEIFDK
ncbi:MAG: AhpC/TSA family protein [Bacteroidales bacterium]|nr:AhpC/TSA family protein [Bacteroidales bacterium]